MMRRIAINTGGGDAPGLNAVIRSVALSALNRGWQVVGIRRGYEGLLDDDPEAVIQLDRDAVRGIAHLGGTILGTTNRGDPFKYPVKKDGEMVPTDVSARVVDRFRELGLDALVAFGGDGSMSIARHPARRGVEEQNPRQEREWFSSRPARWQGGRARRAKRDRAYAAASRRRQRGGIGEKHRAPHSAALHAGASAPAWVRR
jgi:Phosphofructokinase